MDDKKQIEQLPEELQKAIKHIEKSWAMEGYVLTDDDKQCLVNISSGKISAEEEIEKILAKYKKDNENG